LIQGFMWNWEVWRIGSIIWLWKSIHRNIMTSKIAKQFLFLSVLID